MNIGLLFSKLWAWLRVQVVFPRTLRFIWGLIASFVLFEKGVVYLFSDYLSDRYRDNLRKTAILGNLLEGLSSLFVLAIHISQSYVGRFYIIIFCTGASVVGMVLQWISASNGTLYVSLILIALGGAQKSILRYFLKYQLEPHETTDFNISAYLWWYSAWIPGYLLALLWLADQTWPKTFEYAALIIGLACIWFCCGYSCYRSEELSNSLLVKIYRVFRAAWLNSILEYPVSKDQYYWKNITQRDLYLQPGRNSQIQLKPTTSWSCLDKAAIIKDPSSDASSRENQESNGEICPVEQVTEVKRVASMIHFCIILLPYSLVSGAESTFFLLQTDYMRNNNYILVLLSLIVSLTRTLLANSFKWLNLTGQRITIVRIGLGMVCAVLCCFAAWWVETYRKNLAKEDSNKELSIAILLPQYLLLGLAAGLAENGCEVLFCNHVQTMCDSVEPFMQIVFCLGSILTMLLIFSITHWFKNSLNTSQLQAYYLLLAILNIAALPFHGFFSCKYIYRGGHTEDGNQTNTEGVNQDSQVELGTAPKSYKTQGDSDHATAGTSATVRGAATVLEPIPENTGTSTMVESEEQPLTMVTQQISPRSGLIYRSSSLVRRDQTTRTEPS